MPFRSAHVSRVLAGTFHYSTVLTDWQIGTVIDMLETTTIVDSAKQFIVGDETSTATLSGHIDTLGTAGSHLASMNTWKSTPTGLTVAPSGFSLGSELVMVLANEGNITTTSVDNEVSGFSLAAQTDGFTDFGVSLHDLTAETADLSGTGVDNAASSANGGTAQLHVSAFSGFTSAVVIVEHSTNNSVWATLATFATATATTSDRVLVAAGATVNRYLRYSVDVTGTGSVTFQVGFARR